MTATGRIWGRRCGNRGAPAGDAGDFEADLLDTWGTCAGRCKRVVSGRGVSRSCSLRSGRSAHGLARMDRVRVPAPSAAEAPERRQGDVRAVAQLLARGARRPVRAGRRQAPITSSRARRGPRRAPCLVSRRGPLRRLGRARPGGKTLRRLKCPTLPGGRTQPEPSLLSGPACCLRPPKGTIGEPGRAVTTPLPCTPQRSCPSRRMPRLLASTGLLSRCRRCCRRGRPRCTYCHQSSSLWVGRPLMC